jgi:hypothetical protein
MKKQIKKIIIPIILIACFAVMNFNQVKAVDLHQEKAQLLESIGVFSSSNLYLVYLSLSLINENIVNDMQLEGYEEILDSIENINQLTEDNLKKIRKNVTLSDSDIEFIDSIEKACITLKEDASLLNSYLKSGKESDYELFYAKHTEAGKYLEKLFNNK